ncbi:MAG TPA: BlaI/MecI/CopY family transcriptional regulator [Saprospiraceae bacterium]|nr:BlaI/MecI/CopY family transcriptional regulator [Saprospiraceae bacterium]HQW55564.1 BlaI/MecI/CopY family transcriptional regulator [Saprospiraceae bacterium]
MTNYKQLTKAEEEIMLYFWELGKCTVSEIINTMEEPRPPHSSISTIVRILEKKGFLDHKAYGRTYEYFPQISKEEYSNQSIDKMVIDYFDGSYTNLVSFIAKEKDMSVKEINELFKLLDEPEGQ